MSKQKKVINYTRCCMDLKVNKNRTIPNVKKENRVQLDSGHNLNL
jgi:hypothetical protein